MSLDLKMLITTFLSESEGLSSFRLYNEAGLQHELALYLRSGLGNDYRLYLERNIYDVLLPPVNVASAKKEMDIFIVNESRSEHYCIELKFPTKGAFPKRMYQTLEDIKFIEELKRRASFTQVAMLFLTNQEGFRNTRTKSNGGIYRLFREDLCIRDLATNEVPTFIKECLHFEPLGIAGEYPIEWKVFRELYHYFTVCI